MNSKLLRELLQALSVEGVSRENVSDIFLFGSRIYDTHTQNSDYDIVVICDGNLPEVELNVGLYNIHLTHNTTFQRLLNEHNIGAIEQYMSPIQFKLNDVNNFTFNLTSPLLRKSISATVSNSWVKCFKKIRQGDYDIGLKSLFHRLRICQFGIQLAKHNRISDWSVLNGIHNDLSSRQWSELELKSKYQPIRNTLLSEFRTLAEK